MVATWPYLWSNPIGKFIEVVQFMADNPTHLRVLFYGQLFPADSLLITLSARHDVVYSD